MAGPYGTLKADKLEWWDTSLNGGAGGDRTHTLDDIALKATVDSQTFTGNVVLPGTTTGVTQTTGDNSTKLATTAYVDQVPDPTLQSVLATGNTASYFIELSANMGSPGGGKMRLGNNGNIQLYDQANTLNTEFGSDGSATFKGDVKVSDDAYIKLGDSDELSLLHNATGNSLFVSTTSLTTRGTELYFQEEGDSNKEWIHCLPAGSVELSYDGAKKLETTATGVDVEGTLECNVLQLPVNTGSGYLINLGSAADGKTEIYQTQFDGLVIQDLENTAGKYSRYQGQELRFGTTDSAELYCTMKKDGAVELYYDNAKKFETTSTGVTVTGVAVPASITPLTSGANVTVDFTLNNNFTLTTGHGTIQIDNPTTEVAGQSGSIFIVQGSTTCAAPSWGDQWLFKASTPPSLTGTTGKIARVDYIVQEPGKIHCVATDDLGAT